MRLLLTYNASDDDLEQIRAVSDEISVAAAGKLDEAIARAAEVEVIFAGRWSEELRKSAPGLHWVQSWGAGIERFLTPDFVASPIMLTNARAIYAIPIADQVMAFVLHFSRGLNHLVRNQIEHRWHHPPVDELAGKTLGIVGIGGIGEEVARRAKAFDMRIVAVRRRPSLSSAYAEEVRVGLIRQADAESQNKRERASRFEVHHRHGDLDRGRPNMESELPAPIP